MSREATVKLLEELEEIERQAKDALDRLSTGGAVKGTSALSKIKVKAGDAAAWGREEMQRSPAGN